MICKKVVRIGTLAGFERTCMTPTQWANQSDEMKQPYEEMLGKGFSVLGACQGVCDTTLSRARGGR